MVLRRSKAGSFIQGSKEQQNDKGCEMVSIGFTNVFGYGIKKIEGRQFHPGQQGTAE